MRVRNQLMLGTVLIIAAPLLAGCAEEPQAQGEVMDFTSCKTSYSEAFCTASLEEVRTEHLRSGPRYAEELACEASHGIGKCQLVSGGNFYTNEDDEVLNADQAKQALANGQTVTSHSGGGTYSPVVNHWIYVSSSGNSSGTYAGGARSIAPLYTSAGSTQLSTMSGKTFSSLGRVSVSPSSVRPASFSGARPVFVRPGTVIGRGGFSAHAGGFGG